MCTNKNHLRKTYLDRRAAISARQEKDLEIFNRFSTLQTQFDFESFFIYVSMGSEVDTHLLIGNLLNEGKKVCVPRTKDGIMSVVTLHTLPKNFKVDKLGNLYEADNAQLADFECDCAVIPLLSFDSELYRIGYGGGYYDRLLKSFNGIKIGLAYDEQHCDSFEREPHDVGLDFIVTPTRILGRR